MNHPIEMVGISKRFGSVQALQDVSLTVEPNTIHALVGENGAGKTTLMKVLFGQIQPDSGTIRVGGVEQKFQNSRQAIAAHIGMVSQHYVIIPELSCLENLLLGAEPGRWIDLKQAASRAEGLANRMGFEFDWQAPASALSSAAAQKLEILKLLWRESQLMILDEPTAMLSPADSDALYASLHRLTEEGATVIVVTHRLPEVMDHCKDVTVLRGGQLITRMSVAQTQPRELSEAIIGRALTEVPSLNRIPGPPMVQVSNLTVKGHRGDDAVSEASFELRSGEVVGLAGVDGNGQHELFMALTGHASISHGEIRMGGLDLAKLSADKILDAGVRLIPEDRHEEGVIEDWSLEENASLGLQRQTPFRQGAFVDAGARSEQTLQMIDRFRTKCSGPKAAMRSLSGGNQQRFVAARALANNARLVLAFQPTRGLDIDGTRQVYQALRDQSADNATVLVVSFDLDELLEHCDRVLVIERGRIMEPKPHEAKDRQAIGALMVGAN